MSVPDTSDQQPPSWLYSPRTAFPRTGTDAARDFYLTFASITQFALYVVRMASHISQISESAREALFDTAHTDAERDKYQPSEDPPGPLVELAYHRQFFIGILLVRHVENYLNYLSSFLFEIFTQRPECMKSSEKVDLEFLLEHESMETLVHGIAKRKVESLSYSSFSALASFFEDHFSLSICPAEHFEVVNEGIETRNIIVHNRCVINRRYVEKTGDKLDRVGEHRDLYESDLAGLIPILFEAVKSLDRTARRHLGIRGHRFDITKILSAEYASARKRMLKAAAP